MAAGHKEIFKKLWLAPDKRKMKNSMCLGIIHIEFFHFWRLRSGHCIVKK